jgi:hypothetical protein
VKERSTVGSQFFGAFPSDRIPEEMKDVNVKVKVKQSPYRPGVAQRVPGS